MSNEQNQSGQEENIAWGKDHLSAAVDELTDQGIVSTPFVEARIVWMLPQQLFIAELRESSTSPPALWVIGGDVPADHLDVMLADTPRDAARHFGLKWQMAAARDDAREALLEKAELLLALVEADEAWK